MKKLFTALTLCLCCHTGFAQDHESLKQLQPTIWGLLNTSVARIENSEGKEADRARYRLAQALAKSGDSTATHKLATRLSSTGYAASVWATAGQMLAANGHDKTAVADAFARAIEGAKQTKPGSLAERSAYSEIVAAQAHSGDVKGALLLSQGLNEQAQRASLTRLASIAARQGIPEPALALLRMARGETEAAEAQSLLALAVASSEGDTPVARETLAKLTVPIRKIAVLLELFDNPPVGRRGDAALLEQALDAVALTKSSSAFDLSATQRNAARGAIALRQLEAGTDRAAAIQRALATLQEVEKPAEAQKYIELICQKLATEDYPATLQIAERLKGEQRIGALSAIVRGLGRSGSRKNQEASPESRKKVEELVNRALNTANELNENERYWAGIPIASALAQAGEYSAAHQVANSIGSANQRAYAFAGIARAAMENDNLEQGREALKQLEAAGLTEEQPEIAAQIIGQTTLSLVEALLGEKPFDFTSSLVGLE